jgi:hypothetical protein
MNVFQRAEEIAKPLSQEIVTDKAGSASRGIESAFINDHKDKRQKHTLIKMGAGYPNGNQWADTALSGQCTYLRSYV